MAKFKAAIVNSGGIITVIAERLQVQRNTLYAFMAKYPESRGMIQQEQDKILDVAEAKLIEQINRGEQWAVKFMLATKGKVRGYIEKPDTNIMVNQETRNVEMNFNSIKELLDKSEVIWNPIAVSEKAKSDSLNL